MVSGHRDNSFHYQITVYSKRILFGPLPAEIALLQSILKNVSVSWFLTCLTEIFLVKSLMLHKFSYMAGLNDNFMGKFLLIGNIGFVIITHTSRLYIGSFQESVEYSILIGVNMSKKTIFWPIFTSTILSTLGITFGSITIKRFLEKLKDHNLQKHLNVRMNKNISTIEMDKEKTVHNLERNLREFNTLKHNIPLWNGIEFAVIGTFILVIGTTLHFFYLYLVVDGNMIPYQIFLYRGFLNESIFSFFLPLVYLSTKKDLCRFAKMMINNIA